MNFFSRLSILPRRLKRGSNAERNARACHRFRVERLEARQLLAGDVTATVAGSTLEIAGDADANEIRVSQSAGDWQVTGVNGTNVTTSGDLSRINTISIELGTGDDSIELRDFELTRNVMVGGGAGSKSIVIDNVVAREILIENNAAAHMASVEDSTVLRNLGLVTGAGDNSFNVMNTNVTGKVAFRGEVAGTTLGSSQIVIDQSTMKDLRVADPSSDTQVQVIDSALSGQIIGVDEEGSLELDIEDSTVRRGVNIADSTGDFWIGLVNAEVGNMKLRAGGAGDHSVSLLDSRVTGSLRLDSNAGVSSLYMVGDSSVDRTLTMNAKYGSTSTMVLSDNAYVGTSLRHSISDSGNSETLIRDNAVVDGRVQVSNLVGQSNVRIIENAVVGRFIGSGVEQERGVEFANRDGESVLADVYVPKSQGPHPAVVLVHGGYWRFGSKAAMAAEARELAQRGYVAIAIDYRLAPGDKFPAQIHDVKSAIMWARENAATYDIDTDNIGLWGYSAGAHLALLAGLTTPGAGLEGPDAGSFSSEVQAIVAGAPGTDFRDVELNSRRFEYLFGGTRAELPDAYADASPARWISSDDPATFLFVGENDNVISRTKLDQFQQDLDAASVENEMYVAPGLSHLRGANDRTARAYSMRFLDEQLK